MGRDSRYNVIWESGTVSQFWRQHRYLQLGLLGIAATLLVIAVGATRAQSQTTERYYNETGHSVRGPFLAFFDAHGGLDIFGYPITEEFVKDGLLVQYFQRARFEWHPNNPADFRVELSLLGDQLNLGGPIPDARANLPGCQYFPETQHSVCGAFLTYFRDHGGLDVFGYPISEWDKKHDRLMQAFQRARMEWYPEKPAGQKVQLANLGLAAFEFFKEDPNRTPPAAPYTVTSIKLRASVKQPVTGNSGKQTIYAVVTDQQNKAITGADVVAVVHLPTGDIIQHLPPTDDRGRASIQFDFQNVPVGETINIEATVTFETFTSNTRTSFLPWR